MTGIILAGGLATRMGEICCKTPKSMLQFAGYPFLQYLISWFIRLEFSEILIITGWLNEEVESVFGNEFWKSKGIRMIRGDAFWKTGEVVRFALMHSSNEDVFLCNGDTVVDMNFHKFYNNHYQHDSIFTSIISMNSGVQNEVDI